MSANLIVGKDPTGNKVPVAVDAAGKLQIGGVQLDNLNVNTDQIEGKQDVTNALLTTTAADVAAIKSPLSGVTQTSASGKVGLDVNLISGGGSGGASAAYNATLPTYTSGSSSTLQTDVNGRLITTGPELSTIATEAIAIDAKLPSLSSGRVPVVANNAASQVYSFTQSGAITGGTVLIGPIECDLFREISVHVVSVGTGATNPTAQISNNGTSWVPAPALTAGGNIGAGTCTTGQVTTIAVLTARYFRVVSVNNQTSGTTTVEAYASQQATPKLYQSVTGTVVVTNSALRAATTATRSTFSATADTQIVAASTTRPSLVITNNDPSVTLFVGQGSTAVSSTNFSYALRAGDTYIAEPQEVGLEHRGIFASTPTANAVVTIGA